ncbi:PilZ domain-containing protein [Lentibacillus cibarius]|nr:PilZ domain-containing protein [Lentibacillus cibarius]
MYFKRNEPYRYTFSKPVDGRLTKTETDDTVTTNVQILDVSNHGAKIYCPSVVNLQEHAKISLTFELNSTFFQSPGTIVWLKQFRQSLELGLHLDTDDEYKEKILAELKQMAKNKTQ